MGKLSYKIHHLGRVYDIAMLTVRGLENRVCKDLKNQNTKKVERAEMKVKDENYCSQ